MSGQSKEGKAIVLKRQASGRAKPWSAISEEELNLRFGSEVDLALSIERSSKLGSESGLLVDKSIGFVLDLGKMLPAKKLEWAAKEIRNAGRTQIIQVWSKRLAIEAFLIYAAAREAGEIASSIPEQGSSSVARKIL